MDQSIAGAVGGVCTVLVGHPFDLVKVRMQSQGVNSAFDCVAQTWWKEGFRGFFRGLTLPLVGVVPIFAVYFSCYFGWHFLNLLFSKKIIHMNYR